MSFFQLRSIRCVVSSHNNNEGGRGIEDFQGLILHVTHLSLQESEMTSLVSGKFLKPFRNLTHFTYTNQGKRKYWACWMQCLQAILQGYLQGLRPVDCRNKKAGTGRCGRLFSSSWTFLFLGVWVQGAPIYWEHGVLSRCGADGAAGRVGCSGYECGWGAVRNHAP